MKLRTAAVIATTDDGDKIGGPYWLPLDRQARQEIRALEVEYGRLVFSPVASPTPSAP